MPEEKLTIGAIGVGPVGSIFAACLAEAGAKVVATDLPFRIEQIQTNGLQIYWGDRHIQQRIESVDSIKALGDANPDCIFISTKAAILDKLLPDIADVAGDTCLVLSVQNGIGTEDEIAKSVPPKNVCRMVINYAGGNDDEGNTKVAWFNPPNYLGFHADREDPRLTMMVDMLNSSGLTSELVDSKTVKKEAFLKTVLNAALMPTCALMNQTMKQAMENPVTRKIAEDVLKEGLQVAEQLGYEYGRDILKTCMGYLDKGGDHHPSMTVDLSNNRLTEIEFINGKILEIGSTFDGMKLDVNRVLVSLLMTREVMNGTRSADKLPHYLI